MAGTRLRRSPSTAAPGVPIHHWKDGIVTRGVLLDVPRHRGEPFVTTDRPVHGWELEDIAREEGVTLEPGDALVVYSGRENWDKENPAWGSIPGDRPGLHASCLKFIRDSDCTVLAWDMMGPFPPSAMTCPGRCTGRYSPTAGLAGQRFAATLGRGLRRGGPLRVHVRSQPLASGGRHRLSSQPHRPLLGSKFLTLTGAYPSKGGRGDSILEGLPESPSSHMAVSSNGPFNQVVDGAGATPLPARRRGPSETSGVPPGGAP